VSADEECDSKVGCSNQCQLEPGFSFVGGGGDDSCIPIKQWKEGIASVLKAGAQKCSRERQYLNVTNGANGQGKCSKAPTQIVGRVSSALASSVIIPSGNEPSAASQGGQVLSQDFAKQLSGSGVTSVFAVCAANRAQVCAKVNDPSLHNAARRCVTQASYECVEVNTDARYCDTPEAIQAGGVKMSRGYSSRTDHHGQVCVFNSCKTPASWRLGDKSRIKKEAWCFGVAAGAGVVHYLI